RRLSRRSRGADHDRRRRHTRQSRLRRRPNEGSALTTNARLRALVELADTGSVRGAAERLVVTESAISSALGSLSSEVGVPLVDRHGRGVRLTAAGQCYVDYARKILGLHHEAILAARGEVDPEHGSIRLAAVTTAGELLLPALLASFTAKYPGVHCK